MKNNREYIFNILIIFVVVLLYFIVGLFIYNDFRERKRQEMSLDIIKKTEKQIEQIKEELTEGFNLNSKENIDEHIHIDEIKVEYNDLIYSVLGNIKIEKINIYEPILKENTSDAYNISAVKISGPEINEYGNVVIGGHNYMKGNFFIKINKLVKGDVIILTDLKGNSIKYYVYDYGTTTIEDSSYLIQPNKKERILTLVTCTKGAQERYFVKAKAK